MERPIGTLRIASGLPARKVRNPGRWMSLPTGKVSRSTWYPSSLAACSTWRSAMGVPRSW